MMIIRTKIITLFIVGAVFTAGLIMGFGGYVFAGDPVPGLDINIEQIPGGSVSAKNYKSSLSNTKSIGQVRMGVGDVLLGYGFGGEYINQVTEALEGNGVYEAELKSFLLAVGMNEQDTQNILLEFDKLGIASEDAAGSATPVPSAVSMDAPEKEFTTGDTLSAAGQPGAGQIEKGVSTPGAGAIPQSEIIDTEKHRPPVSAPGTGDVSPSASEGTIKGILPSKRAEPAPAITPDAGDTSRAGFKEISGLDSETKVSSFFDVFTELSIKSIQDLKTAESKEQRENIIKELKYRRVLLQQGVQTLRQDLRENAKDLRENFRERSVREVTDKIEKLEIARIAVAHGKGLRMINRYRSAIARFDHILGRLESRIEKIGIEIEGQARAKEGKLKEIYPPDNLAVLIEEAKNTQVLNKAKLAELEAKYESLLEGKNPGGVAEEAREIAKELKSEIEKLHDLLDDIQQATVDYNSSRKNVKL